MGKVISTLFLFVFLACVASCSSHRITTASHEENATHAKFTELADIAVKSGKVQTNDITINSVIEFELYDTSKSEPDGTHPVLAKGTIKSDTKEHSESKENAQSEATIENENITDTETEKEKGTSVKSENRYADAIILFLVLVFVYYINRIIKKQS